MKNKKNVILICIDGCRVDLAKDSKIFTELFPGTVFFSNSITYAPYTNSSIHAFISGVNGNRNGCNSYWNSEKFNNEKFKTLPRYFSDLGYATFADVHSDLIIPQHGFDKFTIYDEDEVNLDKRHPELIESIKKDNDDKSFFIYLHYESIHTTIKNTVLKPFNNFSKDYFEKRKENEERYEKLFEKSERYLIKIHEKINDVGLLKNSIIIIFSDHGISVGEKFGERAYGAFCYDYTIRVFSSIISDELIQKKISQQVRHIDFMPTVLDMLQIPLDENFENPDGVSLVPLIKDDKIIERVAYSETGNPLDENRPPKKPNTKSVRIPEWKMIYNEHNNTKELYDLKNDPYEENNLIGKEKEIEKKLWKEMIRFQV